MRPQNCFQILSIAASVGNQRLLTRSAAVALLCFRQAVMQDPAGLRMLPKEVLGSLLSHDCIQVGNMTYCRIVPVKESIVPLQNPRCKPGQDHKRSTCSVFLYG